MPDSVTAEEKTLSPELEVEESGATVKKVELDLDDAPFLQVEEKAPPAPVETEKDLLPEDEGKKKRKKKLLLFAATGIAVLAIAGVAVWYFMFRTPPPPVMAPEPEVVVVPSTPVPVGQADIVHEFATFVVPVNEDRSQTVFLICKFAAITKDSTVDQEMTRQEIPLRDAVYYYLRGKDAAFLQNPHNYDSLKQDLLSVFNDYLSQGKLEDIVFESYLNH